MSCAHIHVLAVGVTTRWSLFATDAYQRLVPAGQAAAVWAVGYQERAEPCRV